MTLQTIIKLFNLQAQQPGTTTWLVAADYLEEYDIQPLAIAFRQGLWFDNDDSNYGFCYGNDSGSGSGKGSGNGNGCDSGYGYGYGDGSGWGSGYGSGYGSGDGYGNCYGGGG